MNLPLQAPPHRDVAQRPSWRGSNPRHPSPILFSLPSITQRDAFHRWWGPCGLPAGGRARNVGARAGIRHLHDAHVEDTSGGPRSRGLDRGISTLRGGEPAHINWIVISQANNKLTSIPGTRCAQTYDLHQPSGQGYQSIRRYRKRQHKLLSVPKPPLPRSKREPPPQNTKTKKKRLFLIQRSCEAPALPELPLRRHFLVKPAS